MDNYDKRSNRIKTLEGDIDHVLVMVGSFDHRSTMNYELVYDAVITCSEE